MVAILIFLATFLMCLAAFLMFCQLNWFTGSVTVTVIYLLGWTKQSGSERWTDFNSLRLLELRSGSLKIAQLNIAQQIGEHRLHLHHIPKGWIRPTFEKISKNFCFLAKSHNFVFFIRLMVHNTL